VKKTASKGKTLELTPRKPATAALKQQSKSRAARAASRSKTKTKEVKRSVPAKKAAPAKPVGRPAQKKFVQRKPAPVSQSRSRSPVKAAAQPSRKGGRQVTRKQVSETEEEVEEYGSATESERSYDDEVDADEDMAKGSEW